MIDLYYMPSPNTWKVSIMLEECGLEYRISMVDIGKDEQKTPAFLKMNPNGRVPVIVDHDVQDGEQVVFESGAILIYLAEKTGRFLAPSGRARTETLQWLMWQTAGFGPMAGQAHHFLRAAPPGNDYGAQRYTREASRLYRILDGRLGECAWVSGGDYGIADIACWGWVWFHQMHGQNIDDTPHVKRWFEAVSVRPAVLRARAAGMDRVDDDIRAMLDGPYYRPG